MDTSAWCLMEAVSGQTGITVSCIQHIIQVYLKKNTIRNKTLGRALNPHETELNEILSLCLRRAKNSSEEKEGMVERE